MIIFPVKIQIFLIVKLRNMLRIPARLIAVARVRKQGTQNLPLKHIVRGGKRPFHLIVHHTVDRNRGVPALHLIVPPLLPEDFFIFIYIRMKYRVHIHAHQILEILPVAARHRINRLVRISDGIQKGV